MRGRGTHRIMTAAAAGANLLSASLLLTVPVLRGYSAEQVLGLSVLVVSVQAGQSAAVQTASNHSRRRVWLGLGSIVLLSLICVGAGIVDVDRWSILRLVLLGAAGLGFGIYVGGIASERLLDANALGYQRTILSRNVAWLTTVAVASFLDADLLIASLIAWTLAIGSQLFNASRGGTYRRFDHTARNPNKGLWIGSLAGVLYRNDVNVARTMAPVAMFDLWHLGFIVFSLSQAAVGYLVVNEVFSRRGLVRAWLTPRRTRIISSALIVFIGATGLVAALPVAQEESGLVVSVAGLIVMAALVGVQATIAHVLNQSRPVYIGGAIGFLALLGSAAFSWPPGAGLALEMMISSTVVTGALLLQRPSGASHNKGDTN